MISKKDLLNNLKKDLKKIEFKVKHRKLYNAGIRTKKILLGTGMVLVMLIPTVIGATGGIIVTNALNMNILKTDLVTAYEEVGTVTTSNGYFMKERVLGAETAIENALTYSTGWVLNDSGNYERYEITFDFSGLDLSNPDSIFAISEEELEEKLKIKKRTKIEKKTLNSDDEIYNENVLVVQYHYTDKNVSGLVEESESRQELSYALYALIILVTSLCIKKGAKAIFKKLPSERIMDKKDSYKYLTKENIEELRELYQAKKENYEMLMSDDQEGPTLRMMK